MNLRESFRLNLPACLAFVGAGGKTTAIFRLARELQPPVIVTTTTHLGDWQLSAGDRWITDLDGLDGAMGVEAGVVVLTGAVTVDRRVSGLQPQEMERLSRLACERGWSVLIEADGSRQLPLKAPGAHEPQIPAGVDGVVVVAGLSGLGKPCNNAHIHRAEIFSDLSGLALGEPVGEESLCRVLLHPQGGQKGIPANARRVVLLNQADDDRLLSAATRMTTALLSGFDGVLVGCLRNAANDEILFMTEAAR